MRSPKRSLQAGVLQISCTSSRRRQDGIIVIVSRIFSYALPSVGLEAVSWLVVYGKVQLDFDLVAPARLQCHFLPRPLHVDLQDSTVCFADRHGLNGDGLSLDGDDKVALDAELVEDRDVNT